AVSDPVLVRRALAFYQQAVTLDPTFVQAWAQLSRAACSLTNTSPDVNDLKLCRSAAERATALGPDRAESRLAMGTYLQDSQKEPTKALEQFALGLQVHQNNADLLAASARSERSLGRFEAAVTHLQQASRLDPRSIGAASTLARTYRDLHRYK